MTNVPTKIGTRRDEFVRRISRTSLAVWWQAECHFSWIKKIQKMWTIKTTENSIITTANNEYAINHATAQLQMRKCFNSRNKQKWTFVKFMFMHQIHCPKPHTHYKQQLLYNGAWKTTIFCMPTSKNAHQIYKMQLLKTLVSRIFKA